MSLFDNYGSEETTSIPENDKVDMTQVFSDLYPEDQPSENAEPSDSSEHNATDDVVSSDKIENDENNVVEAQKTNSESLTYNDLDAYFAKQKQFEETQAELAKYKAAEAAQLAEQKAKEDKANEMPDPVYHPEEYRKWTYEQNKRMEETYSQRFEQMQNQIVVDTITKSLDSTYESTKEKYGNDVVSNAEKWASNIINSHPKEAIELLKANPSWEYIVSEYKKAELQKAISTDPEAYINARIEERMAQQNVEKDTTTSKRKPSPSINSITSAPDPEKKVVPFLQGLF